MTRWLQPIIGLAVTAVFVWLLIRGLDVADLGQAFGELSLPLLLLALMFLSAGYALRIVRWWWMLRVLEPSLPLKICFWPFLASIAVNNVLPFRAGDALRVFGFRRQLRSPAVRVLGTLIIERMFDLLALLGFFFIGLLGLPDGVFPETFIRVATWLAGFSVAGLLVIVLTMPWLGSIIERIAGLDFFARRNLSEVVTQHGSHFIGALGVVRSPGRLLGLLGLSIVTWGFEGAVFAALATALSAGVDAFGPWFAMGTGTLATLIPSSPGYVGTFDYSAAKGLAAYGADPAVSVAFALTVHAVLWLPLTAAGLGYLMAQGTRFWALKPAATSHVSKE